MTISAEELARDKAICIELNLGFTRGYREMTLKYIAEVERLQKELAFAPSNFEVVENAINRIEELKKAGEAKDAEIARLNSELEKSAHHLRDYHEIKQKSDERRLRIIELQQSVAQFVGNPTSGRES